MRLVFLLIALLIAVPVPIAVQPALSENNLVYEIFVRSFVLVPAVHGCTARLLE